MLVGAPAALGDSDPPGDPVPGDGEGLLDPDGLSEPDGDGDPDDADGDADCGDGEPDGGGEPDCDAEGGGVVGSGGGAWLGGDWLNMRIAMRIASIAMRIMSSHEATIETRPARSWRPGHGSGHSRESPGCTRSIQ